MSGPAPKPLHLKLAEGNPGKKRLTEGPEFRRPEEPLKPPRWLKGEGRKLWKSLVPELQEQGLIANVNVTALTGLCINYARAISAEKIVIEHGQTCETKNGTLMPRPEIATALKSWQAVRGFCQEFGLTPAAAGRIVIPKLKKKGLRENLDESA